MTTKGLPRVADNTRPRSATQVMLYGMVESMTRCLMRGDPIDGDTCATIEEFLRRTDALRNAYTARTSVLESTNDT